MNIAQKAKRKVSYLFHKYYYEPVYTDKLFHNLNLLGARFPVFPDGAAGNSSLLYILLKALYIYEPKKILEMGTGQSSYLMSLYCEGHSDAYCLSVEGDLSWYSLLSNKLKKQNHEFWHNSLKKQTVRFKNEVFQSDFYDFTTVNNKFNLVVLDGPNSGKNRMGFLNYIETVIDLDDFIIIIDDTNRNDETKLCIMLEDKLKNGLGIDIQSYSVKALKHQRIILSPKNHFFKTV